MKKRQKSQFILWNRWFDRYHIVRNMEAFQDIIVILLCFCLFCVMVVQLWDLLRSIFHTVDFRQVTSQILFLLILVELFRLLVVYLQEHSVSVGVAVEVAIVSVLREIIVKGVLEISWVQLLATCGLLLMLGGLLLVCAKTPHMDHFEAYFSQVGYKQPNPQQHEYEQHHSVDYEEQVD